MRRRISQLSAWFLAAMLGWSASAAAGGDALPPAPASFVAQEGGWLRLEFSPAAREQVPMLLEVADTTRAELMSALGRPVLWQARLRLAQGLDELARLAPDDASSGSPSAAYPDFGLVVVSLEGPTGEELDVARALRRELAMLALHEATGGHLPPRWFASGFAADVARERTIADTLTLMAAAVRGRFLPLSRLNASMSASSSAPLAAAQSRDFVHFLRTKQPAAFAGLVERLRLGEPFSDALETAYGERSHALERAWRDQVTTRHGYLPILAAIGLIGASAFGISAWRSARKRRKSAPSVSFDDVTLPPQDEAPDEPPRPVRAPLRRRTGEPSKAAELDVPKVQHDGRWHTLH